jgi:hypothetical protein
MSRRADTGEATPEHIRLTADKYIKEQESRLGPLRASSLTKEQQHKEEGLNTAAPAITSALLAAIAAFKEMPTAPGGQPYQAKPTGNNTEPVVSDEPRTLSDLGITKRQSSDWQKLAAFPREEFEQALESKNVEGLIARPTPVSGDALLFIGTMHDFERRGYLAKTPADFMETMTPDMLEEVYRIALLTAEWISTIQRSKAGARAPAQSTVSRLKLSDLEIAEIMGARASFIMAGKRVQKIAVPKLHAAIEAACNVAKECIEPSQ